jgi:glycosyltransferase involved in cell wall biosynthesis
MKIALVCPAFLPASQLGGIVFLTVELARELSNLGHHVTVYTTDLDFADNSKYFNKKLPRIEKFESYEINRSHVYSSFKLFFINPGMYFQIKKNKPDIIHTIGLRSFQSLMASLVSKKNKIPLIVSDQGGLTTHPFLTESSFFMRVLYKFQNIFVKSIIKQATTISAANEYEKEIFASLGDFSKIEIIRNGINLNNLVSNQNFKEKYNIAGKYILYVGRFSKSKGIENLLNGFNLIKNDIELKNTKLVLMGVDFGFQEEMYEMIKKLDLDKKILVIKKPPREDVISAYGQSEFLILPSEWELSPLVPLESFAFKRPVIGTKTHGIPYTVKHEENGLLVEPKNPKELASAMIRLAKNSKERESFGDAGYKFVNEICNSKAMATNSVKIYHDAIGNNRHK